MYESSTTAGVFAEIGGAFTPTRDNKRFELKLTGTPIVNHTVSGSFLNNPLTRNNLSSINDTMTMTAATLVNRNDVNRLWVVNWNGALTSKLFGTFQWSRKDQGIRDAGGTSTAITDSPFLTRGVVAGSVNNRHYNAQIGRASCRERVWIPV